LSGLVEIRFAAVAEKTERLKPVLVGEFSDARDCAEWYAACAKLATAIRFACEQAHGMTKDHFVALIEFAQGKVDKPKGDA